MIRLPAAEPDEGRSSSRKQTSRVQRTSVSNPTSASRKLGSQDHNGYGEARIAETVSLLEPPAGNLVGVTARLEQTFHIAEMCALVDGGLQGDARFPFPADDIDGDPRSFDGDGDGVAVIDIGADEFSPNPDCADDGTCNPDCGLGAR